MGNVKVITRPPVVVSEELAKMTPTQRQFCAQFLVSFREHAAADVVPAFDAVLAEMAIWERDHGN